MESEIHDFQYEFAEDFITLVRAIAACEKQVTALKKATDQAALGYRTGDTPVLPKSGVGILQARRQLMLLEDKLIGLNASIHYGVLAELKVDCHMWLDNL